MSTPHTSIEGYIQDQPPEVQPILRKIRQVIQKAIPAADETISYGLPTLKLHGRPVVYFGTWKEHIGFYATSQGNAAFRKELAPYQGAKGSVRFPLDQPIPYELIRQIATYRAKEVTAENTKGS